MSENKALRWVKANERLPKQPDSPWNHYQLNGQKINGNFYDLPLGGIAFCVISSHAEDYHIYEKDFNRIEWLQEYIPDQPCIDREGGMQEEKIYRWVKADLSQGWDSNDYTTEVIVKTSGIARVHDVTVPSTILYFLNEGRDIYFLQEKQTTDHAK